MGRALITITLLFGLCSIPGLAQELSLGGGLGYGSGIQNLGINIRGDVRFNELWSVSPNFNLFFNKNNGTYTSEWKDLNIDGHLYFKLDQRWNIYPLLGLNFATVSEKEDNLTFTNSDVGLNLGLGAEFKLEKFLSGFGEAKYVASNADQVVVTVGVIYRLTQ